MKSKVNNQLTLSKALNMIYLKKYYQEHKELIKKRSHKRYENNKEAILKQRKDYQKNNVEKLRNYRQNNKEILKSNLKKFYHSKKGKIAIKRYKANRKGLGFVELNEYFEGSQAHHINREFILYIPKELHRSVFHNVWNGIGMNEINDLAIEYAYGTKSSKNEDLK